ncbi:rhodanese-like domain-containing protein [Bacillus cereus]|nr:rhodanese-like domain-containing protein [Bacillus cereus]KAA6469886.1 rhodanese-like domain-containing protein [Bacillus cereus]KAB2414132.1 rhodanese-like domain-containing protein [Bacillus cereus]KAB2434286.1 rhodanese-like domain-containing protein [Bacillus cereus]KAB2467201.1 rhodanese-like domain-containing protein [Bacillus cereus]
MSMNVALNIIYIVLIGWFMISRFLPVKGVKNISTKELKAELKKKNNLFIDVRTPGEFRSNHIHGFRNIPLNELPQRANSLDKQKEIIVICQSGMRSKIATKILKKLGFKHIINVSGGMGAWN